MATVYAMYLRKSRADEEAEARGEGETLARHRRALTELAARRGYNVIKVYEEIGSADTIANRPQVQQLLAEVEAGVYDGVLVNDADRLGRGDGIDQGIIKQAFYSSGTQIITPYRTFDPGNPSDEDYFDFSMFLARFEYRKINQRMQTGRARSAAEGNYLGTRISFGYDKVKRTDRAGYTLVPNSHAPTVQAMFEWYAGGDSANAIAIRLNEMGVLTSTGCKWEASSVRHTLQNPCYIGTTTWNKKVKRVRGIGSNRKVTREKNPEPIIVENAHEPLVSRELFDRVQKIFHTHERRPKNNLAPLANPMAGLIICSECGRAMQRGYSGHAAAPDTIRCPIRGCKTAGIAAETLENSILDVLRKWTVKYSTTAPQPAKSAQKDAQQTAMARQLETLNTQLDRLYDLLEQGIYTPAEFVKRRDDINNRIAATQDEMKKAEVMPSQDEIIQMNLPKVESLLDIYSMTLDPQERNKLLRSVIEKVIYKKTVRCKRNENPADFLELDVIARYLGD